MDGYKNKFEIALGLKETPMKTLKDIRHDDKFKKNRTLMELIKQMLAGFKKWFRIGFVSALKGLNPFGSDKVEAGYYDYKKTAEFKQLSGMVAYQMGIDKAYLREETLDQYKAISLMYKEKKLDISGLRLTEENLFYDEHNNRTVTVITQEQYKRLKDFAKSNPKYEQEPVAWYISPSGAVVVDADKAVTKAFLEKEHLGREAKSRDAERDSSEKQQEVVPEKEPSVEDVEEAHKVYDISEIVPPGRKFTDGMFEYTLTEKDKVVLNKYVGKEAEIRVPEGVVVNGQRYAVAEIMTGAFVGTPVKQVTMNAMYWCNAMYCPTCFVTSSGVVPKVVWENLTPQQEKQLDENKEWAKELARDENGVPIEDDIPIQEKEEQQPEQEKREKSKGFDL